MAFPDTDLQVQILAYLGADPTASSGSWPAATDLSSRLLDGSLRITRGRGAGQTTLSSGSCTFDLNNTDGALTPLMATSPYYGDWDVGTPVAVNVTGVGASPPYGRFRGYIADLTQTFVPGVGDANISVVRVTLGGKARQITQGKNAASVMRRFINANPPTSYWALDGGTLADDLAAGVSGDPALIIYGYVDPLTTMSGDGTLAPWLADGLLLDTSTFLAAPHTPRSGGWTMDLLYRIDAARGDKLSLSFLMFDGGSPTATPGSTPNISVRMFGIDNGTGNAGTVKIGFPNTNTAVASQTLPGTALQGNTLHHIRLQATDIGGGQYTLASWLDGVALISATVTGTVVYGSPAVLVVDEVAGLGQHDGSAKVAVGWMSVWTGTPPALADAVAAAFGMQGEQAHTRIARICAEDDIPATVTATRSAALGPQPFADPFAILADAEAADHGVLYELAGQWGFGYRAASQRENLAASLTVDLATYRLSDDSASVLTPVRNDAKVRNEWTVSRPDGGSATVADLGHQVKHGRYDDSGTVNLNLDSSLVQEASWRVHEGTYDGLRYRTMPIDLGANPASPSNLLTPWLTTELGDRIDRTNNPTPEHPYDGTTLILQGYTETLTHKTWKVDAVVEPYEPWRVMNVANASPDLSEFLGRAAGDAACAIRTDITSSTTSIPFDPTWFRWTTTASHFSTSNWPAMQVRLKKAPGIAGGGEVVTVSAISTTAATFVAVGTPAHADNAAVTPALYAGGQAGDLILVVAAPRGSASLATPAGYQNIIHGTIFVFAKRHTGSESAPTITPSGGASGDTLSAFTFGLRNMPAIPALADLVRIDPPDASGSSTQNIPFAGATPPDAGSVVLLLAWKGDDYTSVAPPAGFTEMVEASTTVGNDQSLYAAYQIQTTPTVVQPGTIVVTGGTAANTYCLTVVLAGGYQTATVTRSANGVSKAHSAGTLFALEHPLIQAL